ncbi:YcaO-like family protein [Streptomyces sp. enrichment culture]|uniref:YcaO-like family protein n=1 Tax=Streptomyces sp. enrichment culture TaxID=1795815 RepID=UPI003F54965A
MIDVPRTLAPAAGVATRYSLVPPRDGNPLWSSAVALAPVAGADPTEVPLSALVAGANGHSRADALLRGAGEAVERRALHPDDRLGTVRGTAAGLGRPALAAHDARNALAHPDAAQAELDWYPATRLSDTATVLVPAALVDWPATASGALFDPGPSGAASGGSADMALRSALVEIVERDAFTTAWGRQLRLPCWTDPFAAASGTPDRPTGEALRTLWRRAADGGVRTVFARIPTAVDGLCCVVACLLEPERPGALVTVGMKASDRAHDALLGALQEAWQVRAALEATLLDGPVTDVPDPLVTEHDRIRYMLTARARRAVRDWADGFVPAPAPMTAAEVTTDGIVTALLADGADPHVVDLTPRLPDTVAAMGWHAVKVVPAGYQHLRMDETHAWSWNRSRLASAPERTGCPARLTDHRAAAPHPLP